MPNPYTTIASNYSTQSGEILNAFSNAETELQSQSAPSCGFLELTWDGIRILETSTNLQVSSLSSADQYRLYPQLGGLFNFALSKVYYP